MRIGLSASTVAFPGLPLSELPKRAAALGLDGIALNVSERGSMRPDAPADDIRDLLARCRDLGIAMSAIYGYAGRSMLCDAVMRAADLGLARRCIDLAVQLEAPVCRIFAWSGAPTDEVIDRFVEACRPAAEHASQAGIVMGFPTHHDLAFDPKSCRRLISGFGRERAGIIFNGPSMELDGIAPGAALLEMKDIVEQIELKDWVRPEGHEIPVSIGEGQATVWPILEALDVIDFKGWVTLHHLKQHHPELPDLAAGTVAAVRRSMPV